MYALEAADVDIDLTTALVASASDTEAVIALSLLRDTLSDSQLVLLANLRELLLELPQTPFRTGHALEILARAGLYEDTGRSYRRLFESNHGVFGLEFLGRGNTCLGILVHTPASRFMLRGDAGHRFDSETLEVLVNHAILLDAVIEGVELLGMSLDPKIYLSVEDFLAEKSAAAAKDSFALLF
jgi:hypothetical protein